ncbi:MAG: MoaD/ThiS family protein [Flavobacteriaceae bacterium]|nr:MoaD/ThiS family protein [Flavobacteriaceae bacterium]
MKIKSLFFGIAKDLSGSAELILDIPVNMTIGEFESLLSERLSGLKDTQNFAFAANESFVERDYHIKENDVIAILPPVSGG